MQLTNFNLKKYVSMWYNFFQYIATLSSLYIYFFIIQYILYIGIGVDFFLKKANSSGARIFIRSLFFVYRVARKNEPLFVKYFLGDDKPKIIEIL